MLLRWRRSFAILTFLLLLTPLVVGLVAPDSPATVLKEGRSLAPAPRLPASGAGWLAMPAAVDAYLKDHFGLRQTLITAHRELTKPMLGFGNDSVLVGRDGRMFYLGENAVRQSAAPISSASSPSTTCAAFLSASEKAAAQWELERRFVAFEMSIH